MKVIFYKDVSGVGKRFDMKEVSDGYATNFLLPRNLAVKANAQEIAKLEAFRATETKLKAEQEAALIKNLKKISEVVVEIAAPANEKGHLFKGIGKEEVAAALKASSKIDINPVYMLLEKPIKEVGDHKISVKIGDNNGFFTVKIVAE